MSTAALKSLIIKDDTENMLEMRVTVKAALCRLIGRTRARTSSRNS